MATLEPAWLPLDQIIAINEAETAEAGEPHALRDMALLESAQAKPLNHWFYGETDIVRLAVVLLGGIARNHPFEQGNKRTAQTAALVFMEANGCRWTMPDNEELGRWVEALIRRDIDEDALAASMTWFVEPCDGVGVDYDALRQDVMRRTVKSRAWLARN